MKFFHDLFSFKWQTTNDLNYLAVPCFKICPADPLDEIVPLLANLPVNAAKLAYETTVTDKFISPHSLTEVLDCLLLLFDFDSILHTALLTLATEHIDAYLASLGKEQNFKSTFHRSYQRPTFGGHKIMRTEEAETMEEINENIMGTDDN